ncbi:MAG TPA: M3 family metallopeptidase [Rhizomicrobium sp.]|jgi:peptidyl-dipeptidase Dcp|nr:M3 family metallopeptidase [Rhizomicrobium sp.]
MTNPFFEDWTAPYGAPPLDRIAPEHFPPAYDRALAEHVAQVAAIAENPDPPSFENVVVALEKSGRLLTRVEGVFHNLAAAATNEALQAIELEMAPRLSAHWSAISMHPVLFARLDAVYRLRDTLGLDTEALRVLERYHLDFVRAGAQLKGGDRDRLAAIAQRLAVLGTQFNQHVLGDEEDWTLSLNESQMAGIPPAIRDAAAAKAAALKLEAPFAVTLSRSSVEPFLQYADDRGLREQLYRAWISRGDNDNSYNNTAIISETLALRADRAKLLGYENFAAFKLADSMAGTPAKARALLEEVWEPARKRALEERDALQALITREGNNFRLAPWDWRYYAEKLRQEKYAFDAEELKPYFQLSNLIEAAFFTASRLFGLSFRECEGMPVYHADVRVWEVVREGQVIGLFYGDYFARPGKQSGAWMSSFRDQQTLEGEVLPIIINNSNFSKSDPCLLSFDDAVTLFHEMGHALHGLLSQVHFPRLSGTNVARDFVELPSQLYEHWLEEPAVLERFARHHQTGEPMPKPLLQKLLAARNYGQGFATVEFLASALIDMDFHTLPPGSDPKEAQAQTLARIGMPDEIGPRHAAPHFTHVFGGDGYASGYYAYLWSEVLDADGFKAFEEAHDPFDPATAHRLYKFIYSAGGTRDFATAYRAFRGRDPHIEALLEGRGLLVPAA